MLVQKLPLSGVVVFLRPFRGSGMKIIKPRFSDGSASWVAGESFELGQVVVLCLMHITWMDTHTGKDLRVGFRNRQIGLAVVEASGQSDHAVNAVLVSAVDDFAKFIR